MFSGKHFQKFRRQQGDVILPVTQCRHMNRENVESIKEILPEPPGIHLPHQVTIGSGQNPHVHPDCFVSAHPLKFLLLQDPQKLCLELRRYLADLVEQYRAVIGQLETTLPPLRRSGE
ncbi:MAG: hypothetical protein BWY82_02003 [Verrucomicrobia bacterium ADurb.Bin474]|nr:MAG: hypothetical protein BWY82_02003 [Verrucomicrobia bacterium ADurb.Bin474]